MYKKISLTELYKGQAVTTQRKQTYVNTKALSQPFIYTFKQYNYFLKIYVETNKPLEYTKILIQLIVKNNIRYKKCINMTYAIDIKNPTWSFYSNIYDSDKDIFYPGECVIGSFNPNTNLDYNTSLDLLHQLDINYPNKYATNLLSINCITNALGPLLRLSIESTCNHKDGLVKIAPITIVKAYKQILEVNQDLTLLDFYELLYKQQTLEYKDITNQYFKMYLIFEILKKTYYANL